LYEWLIIGIPLGALFILWLMLAAKSRKRICSNCDAELIKFIRSEKEGGVSILWMCGSITPTIVGLSSSMPHQDWFISCKGTETKIDGMKFDNLSKEELINLTKKHLPFNIKKPKCPDCDQPLYKYNMVPRKDGSIATLWLCGTSKIQVIQTRANGAVQDLLLSCSEMRN
jgi:RNase P subunit RPR2